MKKKNEDSRLDSFDVKVCEVDMDSFTASSMEEVMTLCVTRVKSRVIGRRNRSIQ